MKLFTKIYSPLPAKFYFGVSAHGLQPYDLSTFLTFKWERCRQNTELYFILINLFS